MKNIIATTRKTNQGYFQPVLKVFINDKNFNKFSPTDMNCPTINRKTAQRQADLWRKESIQAGYIINI